MTMPTGYKRLDYIQSSGTQYIDTGFSPNQDTRVLANILYPSLSSEGAFGSRSSYNENAYTMSPNFNGDTSLIFFNYNNGYTNPTSPLFANTIHNIDFNKNTLYVDGNLITSRSYATFGTPHSMLLFANYREGAVHTATCRYYYCKIYNNGMLIRDYIPVQQDTDNKVGLYDLVNDVFYENQGTGDFTYGHILTENIELETNPLQFELQDNVELIANFKIRYQITLNYDSSLGSASYEWGQGANVILTATPNANVQFLGWYYNSQKISDDLITTYPVNQDSIFEARFEQIYTITTNVDGNGAIQYTRATDQNEITFSVIPSANHHFVKYVIGANEITTTPYTLRVYANTSITAYFEEDEKYHITATTNFKYGSVDISVNDVYAGTNVVLWARPFPNHNFDRWSDGNKDNPRTISVSENITLLAEYVRITETNGIYQYRCFVKDQLDLTASPKAFMVVNNFKIREDKLTKATSTIEVLEMNTNVNNGDIVVVYDPKGTRIYQGVINSIEDKKLNCSQMQSFYKGTWIYNTSPQTYLEQEIAYLLGQYAQGKLYGSTYTDPLVAQRLGGITIQYTNSTQASLPNDLDSSGNAQYTQIDMEEWIYQLYQKYQIDFQFVINFSGANYVYIKVPTYSSLKVGNNIYAIKDMSPITEIEETNKLVIYNQNKTYVSTYIATKTGIVEAPSSTANRFNITNTKVVFMNANDTISNIVANNLPSTMYNHKLTFTLVLNNFIYDFNNFKLTMPLDVWYGSDYYNSVLTGWEMQKKNNQNITQVDFVCGLVRTKLTNLLTLGKV